MTEKEKKAEVDNNKDEIKKLVDEELEGVVGGSAPGVLKREPDSSSDNNWN